MFSIEGAKLEISRDRPSSVKQGHENGEKKKIIKKCFRNFQDTSFQSDAGERTFITSLKK